MLIGINWEMVLSVASVINPVGILNEGLRIRHRPKKYCPLCKDAPTSKIGDYTYQCIRCGFVIDEAKGQPAYHKHVLVAKPSIVGIGSKKKYYIKDPDLPSRHELFSRINKDMDKPNYDRDSMLNPNQNLQPGKIGRTDLWMSSDYASMATDAITEEQQKRFRKLLKVDKYSY